ncbi:hypothetical protein [Actinomadura sp. SCN-SB]|uniref:hypothetical protein n=1 Tax=Actinomadura sp. SCN-SB TaxID=3373092 RepID=UPI003750E0DC
MTTPPQTRHVTLCVTHPGGDGHLTLDHHIPVDAADALLALVLAAPDTPDGGRHVTLHVSVPGRHPVDCIEVDDATADRVIAAMRAHMPERTYVDLLRELVDPDDCHFDHNGFCQAHGFSPPCPHAQAKTLLAALDQPAKETP